jgi:glycerol uptake facilitator protein
MLVQQLAGGTLTWSQLPVYLFAELAAGAAAGLAYGAISRTRADRSAHQAPLPETASETAARA